MKNLITNTALALLLSLVSTIGFADVIKFEKCTPQDISLLSASHNFDHRSIRTLIKDDILPNITSCSVEKPYAFVIVPAVCGYMRKKISNYKIETKSGSKYTATVDTSYIACQRSRSYPFISAFGFKTKRKAIRNESEL
jgi:hypothetical protein